MTIVLMKNKSEIERVDKNIEAVATLTGTLRSGTSVIDPVIIVEANGVSTSDIVSCNYLQIEEFSRYYFVNNITSIRKNIWELSCHVDVLQTYKDYIREQRGIVQRQENKWNLYLNDGSFKAYQNPMIVTLPFPKGFTVNEFVLAIAGS